MTYWTLMPRFAKFILTGIATLFIGGASVTYKALAYKEEFRKELMGEVKDMRHEDMSNLNTRLDDIKKDVRDIKRHLMERK